MTESQYKSAYIKAEAMYQTSSSLDSHYWRGYMRGLRRGYHGDHFGTDEEHRQWWNAGTMGAPIREQLQSGYRDAIYWIEFVGLYKRVGTQREVAEKLGVSVGLVQSLVLGRRRMRPLYIYALRYLRPSGYGIRVKG